MYSASLELGWWRTRAELGDFGPGDYLTQAELIGPDGVGLLVYGSGIHWGTAYLGPDGHAPDSAGTLVEAPGAAAWSDPGPPGPGPVLVTEAPLAPEPELVDIAAGEGLRRDPQAGGAAAPGRVGPGRSSAGPGAAGPGVGGAAGERAPPGARDAGRRPVRGRRAGHRHRRGGHHHRVPRAQRDRGRDHRGGRSPRGIFHRLVLTPLSASRRNRAWISLGRVR